MWCGVGDDLRDFIFIFLRVEYGNEMTVYLSKVININKLNECVYL